MTNKIKRFHDWWLLQPEWLDIQRQVIERDQICQMCGDLYIKGQFDCHHTSYDNFGCGDARELKDCILVCACCHRKLHNLPTPINSEELNTFEFGEDYYDESEDYYDYD